MPDFFRTENFWAGKFSRSEFLKPDFFGCKIFKVRFFLDAIFFVRKFLRVKISKPEIFRAIQFFPAKSSVSAKGSTSEAYRILVTFFMIGPENFRAENFLCRIFFGLKISRFVFFGCKKFKVRFFSDAKFFCP